MKEQFKAGDLVYVPSDVTLFNEVKTHKLEKPTNLLVTGKKNNYYEVLYNGNSWYIEDNSVYRMKEETC